MNSESHRFTVKRPNTLVRQLLGFFYLVDMYILLTLAETKHKNMNLFNIFSKAADLQKQNEILNKKLERLQKRLLELEHPKRFYKGNSIFYLTDAYDGRVGKMVSAFVEVKVIDSEIEEKEGHMYAGGIQLPSTYNRVYFCVDFNMNKHEVYDKQAFTQKEAELNPHLGEIIFFANNK